MDGNIDFFGGAGVLNVGHCNSEVIKAVVEQEKSSFTLSIFNKA
jgi:acetylornithine/succinyldiaminopimelate/putrescine aminotransferase